MTTIAARGSSSSGTGGCATTQPQIPRGKGRPLDSQIVTPTTPTCYSYDWYCYLLLLATLCYYVSTCLYFLLAATTCYDCSFHYLLLLLRPTTATRTPTSTIDTTNPTSTTTTFCPLPTTCFSCCCCNLSSKWLFSLGHRRDQLSLAGTLAWSLLARFARWCRFANN